MALDTRQEENPRRGEPNDREPGDQAVQPRPTSSGAAGLRAGGRAWADSGTCARTHGSETEAEGDEYIGTNRAERTPGEVTSAKRGK